MKISSEERASWKLDGAEGAVGDAYMEMARALRLMGMGELEEAALALEEAGLDVERGVGKIREALELLESGKDGE